MSRRLGPAVGLTLFGGISYYLYNAGGDAKLAEKKAEREFTIAHGSLLYPNNQR